MEDLRRSFVLVERIPLDVAVLAAKIRHKARKMGRRWSYVDTIGYVLAKRIGARFLTGDKEFKGVGNVVFIG